MLQIGKLPTVSTLGLRSSICSGFRVQRVEGLGFRVEGFHHSRNLEGAACVHRGPVAVARLFGKLYKCSILAIPSHNHSLPKDRHTSNKAVITTALNPNRWTEFGAFSSLMLEMVILWLVLEVLDVLVEVMRLLKLTT